MQITPLEPSLSGFQILTKSSGLEKAVDEGIIPQISEDDASELENNQSMDLEATGPRPVEAYVLTEFANAIDENPDFEILNYVSWIQEPVPKSQTKSISLDIPFTDSFLSTEFTASWRNFSLRSCTAIAV